MSFSSKELWKLGRRIEIVVEAVNPEVKYEGGGQGTVVFHTFSTDVTGEDGEKLGFISGGVGHVVLSRTGHDEGMWLISHEDLWHAFMAGLEGVGPVPVVDKPVVESVVAEPEPEPVIVVEPEIIEAPKPGGGEIVFLEITSYCGIVASAVHWYGKLKPWKGDIVELRHVLTARQAEKLSVPDFTWHEGDETIRWESKESLIQCAFDTYRKFFPEAKVLIQGGRAYVQAQQIIAGLGENRSELNTLYLECESYGFWDKKENEQYVKPINDEWLRLFNEAMGREVYRLT